jgi:hypothetical protein
LRSSNTYARARLCGRVCVRAQARVLCLPVCGGRAENRLVLADAAHVCGCKCARGCWRPHVRAYRRPLIGDYRCSVFGYHRLPIHKGTAAASEPPSSPICADCTHARTHARASERGASHHVLLHVAREALDTRRGLPVRASIQHLRASTSPLRLPRGRCIPASQCATPAAVQCSAARCAAAHRPRPALGSATHKNTRAAPPTGRRGRG